MHIPALLKIITLTLLLIGLCGCKLLGEDEETDSLKQMVLTGAVEPDLSSQNGFLSGRPDGFLIELVKQGQVIDSKVVLREIATNSYPFQFAGLYPEGELHLRAHHQNQYLEMYLGNPSTHNGPFSIGSFPMSKAALATRFLKNLSFFPEISKLSSSSIIDVLAYLISVPVSAMQNRDELLLSVNRLRLDQNGSLITDDQFFPEWNRHPERFTNEFETQLAQNMQRAGVLSLYEQRVMPTDYEATNFLQSAQIVDENRTINIENIQNNQQQPIVIQSNAVSNSRNATLILIFKADLDDQSYAQILSSSLIIQGQESLQKLYQYEIAMSELNPIRESVNSISFSLIKPNEQSKYASHFSLLNDLSNTIHADQYDLRLYFSLQY